MTPTEQAKAFSRGVLVGKIPAGPYVRLACKRFEADLVRSDWGYEYRADLADRACRFMEKMPHTKGKWSAKKERLKFQWWQSFIECNLFGFVRQGTELRRFRESYEEVPRKNGKSIRLAARGLYLFAADGEAGAEVYSGATTEKQAHEVFRPAWQMVNKMAGLRERFGIEQAGNSKNPGPMYVLEDMSKFEPIIGKPGDGASPHAALIDEYHEHESDDMVDTMQTGMGAREQPLLSIITTAGSNLGGPCFEKRKDIIRILEGQVQDETIFGIIFGLNDAEEDVLFQSSDAIGRLENICNCANADLAVKSCVEAFVAHVVQDAIDNKESFLHQDVQTTLKGLQPQKDFAAVATNATSKKQTPHTRQRHPEPVQSGQKEIQKELKQPSEDSLKSLAKPNLQTTEGPLIENACMELNKLITILYTKSNKASAEYAKVISDIYAWIIATPPALFEACFAKNVIPVSAFSAMISAAFSAHSNTCETHSQCKDDGAGVLIKISADEWDSPGSMIKANPNYGISVFPEFLEAQLDQARRSASKQNAFRTKHLNQWVGARTAWMNMLAWQRQKKNFTIEDMKGCRCWMAVDLASKKDVAALVMVFDKGGHWYVIPRFYVPEKAAEENDKYRNFALSGDITLTPGDMTDYEFIEEDIKLLASQVDLQTLSFDDWQANYLMTRLSGTSIKVVDYNQTVRNMSEPMKEVEARTLARKIWHNGNLAMTWMMGNVSAKVDAKENIYPRKDNENDKNCKIDGPVGLIMAAGAIMVQEPQKPLQMFMLG